MDKQEWEDAITVTEEQDILVLCSMISEVATRWNGSPYDTFSVALAAPAEGAQAAVDTYLRGCREHDGHFCTCDWYVKGRGKLHTPEGWW